MTKIISSLLIILVYGIIYSQTIDTVVIDYHYGLIDYDFKAMQDTVAWDTLSYPGDIKMVKIK